MRSCGFTLPAARITVNLAPADRRKAGSAYDLPLAVALLGAAGVLPAERLEGWFLAGELSLSGAIKMCIRDRLLSLIEKTRFREKNTSKALYLCTAHR